MFLLSENIGVRWPFCSVWFRIPRSKWNPRRTGIGVPAGVRGSHRQGVESRAATAIYEKTYDAVFLAVAVVKPLEERYIGEL